MSVKDDVKSLAANSHLFDGNFIYIEQLYEDYLKNPNSVDEKWQHYFKKFNHSSGAEVSLSDTRQKFLHLARNPSPQVSTTQASVSDKTFKMAQLIDAYRRHGHHQAKLDPLELGKKKIIPSLDLNYHGFTPADFNQQFDVGTFRGTQDLTLKGIFAVLKRTYCDTFAVEYMHLSNFEEITWLQQQFEPVHSHPILTNEQKVHLYKQLVAAEGLEKYLGAKYVGQKRFSLEGGASLIPMLDNIVQNAGSQGVKEIILGMAHRGRLNVLVNILGKSPEVLFKEFEGKHDLDSSYSGDVKYHMGFSSDVKTAGGALHLALTFNPSHLEIINPVVEGAVRARQDRRADNQRSEIIPLLVHGDAAFAGQGVVMETFALSLARGFTTGGTVHIVINNQIGFTISNPLDARSSEYCTDIAKMIEAPVIHVNGDDPEACVFATKIALDYRMKFKKDVIIDLVCYRRHGHNEADEPTMTQPIMYRKIKQHPYTSEIYRNRLITENVLSEAQADKAVTDYRNLLDAGKMVVDLVPKGQVPFLPDWKPYKNQKWNQEIDTTVPVAKLKKLSKQLAILPEGFKPHPQVEKELEMRRKMGIGDVAFNWGGAEILAYATILAEGYPVRLSGQDAQRGTFSHRHSVLHDMNDGAVFTPLQHINGTSFTVVDSVLSEEGVIGFEYGYATTDPTSLVLWEAQFGDFANGAQVLFDQFISSGEQKWGRLCGLTLLLPHGYEGQGPEHTSARLERYLQLCAQDNMQVCIPTTPAQMFHMLRRQILRPYRKPLIVMTPKSLLRHRSAVSTLEELANGSFQLVIPETEKQTTAKVRRVIICSGKVYYDLMQKRAEKKINDIAILRLEQLYPFPKSALTKALAIYKNAKEVIWCQEEPKNQGAWYSTRHRLQACLSEGQELHYTGRAASASPAAGYTSVHVKEQESLINDALKEKSFSITK